MSLRIATNVPSITAQRSLNKNQQLQDKSMAQISTGNRITKAADDAAGLSISENLKTEVRSYKQALRNAHDGVSLIQVAEGALGEVNNMMTRFRELAIQASSDTVGDNERGFIQNEVEQLKAEVQRIADSTQFGDKKLLNGEGDSFDFQVGIQSDPEMNSISYDASETNATLSSLGVESLDFSTKDGAQSAINEIDAAAVKVSGYRANLGALQNRLTTTTETIGSSVENLSSARSRIMDADIAQSSANLTKSSILLNATTSVLSQANSTPQQALQLIG
ncbi:MAG: flagellin FliC [Bdellovibrionales bacterium]|nr:flagellin FliC [Bdellovibrionales bacterium]NQZ18978.1 flagellin FliC [Bdellovibrionales bacterium]